MSATIDDVEIARALHVVFVAHWIGGVAFVTLVALPLARAQATRKKAGRCSRRSKSVSRRRCDFQFRSPARPASGWPGGSISGELFAEPAAWWMDAMVLLWAVFMVIVFVVEPLAHRRVAAMAAEDPAALLLRLSRVHRVLLAAGIVTIFGAVAGAHGGIFG